MKKLSLILVIALLTALLAVTVVYAASYSRTSCHTHSVNGVSQFKICHKTTFTEGTGGIKPTTCTYTFQTYVSGWTRTLKQSWCVESYYAVSGEHMRDWAFYKNGVYKGYLTFWHTYKTSNPGVITLKFADGLP